MLYKPELIHVALYPFSAVFLPSQSFLCIIFFLFRWVFKQLYDKGLVYRGVKVMPFSTACNTPLSNFESHQNYKVGTNQASHDSSSLM